MALLRALCSNKGRLSDVCLEIRPCQKLNEHLMNDEGLIPANKPERAGVSIHRIEASLESHLLCVVSDASVNCKQMV